MIPLFLTRPLLQSHELAEAIEAAMPQRFEMILTPLVEIGSEEAALATEGAQALLFSSATAVREFAARSSERFLPALCVGDKTAATAQALGFSAQSASGDAAALAELAAVSYLEGAGHFLYPRGRQSAGDVAGSLMAQGIPVDEVILYHQRPVSFSQNAVHRLAGAEPIVVPLFSNNAGQRLIEELSDGELVRHAPLSIVAISGNVAAACSGIPGAEVYVAPQPDAQGIAQVLAAF